MQLTKDMPTWFAGTEMKLLDLLFKVQGPQLCGKGASDAVQEPLQFSVSCSLRGLTPLGIPLLPTSPAP